MDERGRGKTHKISVKSYGDLTDKPQINGLELVGNKSWFDLKLAGTRTNAKEKYLMIRAMLLLGLVLMRKVLRPVP